MAGGAPSRQSQALAKQLAEQPQAVTLDLDAVNRSTPPRESLTFTTAVIRTHATEESRDEETGEIEEEASLELEFVGPAILMPIGNQILAQGGKAFRTKLGPDFAVAVLEEALAEAKRVAESRQEEPVKLEGLAATPADMRAAAAAADAVEQLKQNGQGG